MNQVLSFNNNHFNIKCIVIKTDNGDELWLNGKEKLQPLYIVQIQRTLSRIVLALMIRKNLRTWEKNMLQVWIGMLEIAFTSMNLVFTV